MAGGFLLSMEGIGGNQSALQVQRLQEAFEFGDFIGFVCDFDLTASQCRTVGQSTEKMNGLIGGFGGAAETFAVDGQDGSIGIAFAFLEPRTDNLIQFLRIDRLKKAADGRFARSDVAAASAVFAGAQGTQLVLIERLGELTDTVESVDAREHGSHSDGEN